MFSALCLWTAVLLFSSAALAVETLALEGTWRFRMDPEDRGAGEAWFHATLPEAIDLPGALRDSGYGNPITADTAWTGTIQCDLWHTDPRFEAYRDPEDTKILF